MKLFKNIIAIALIAIVVVACKNDAKPEVKTVETEETTATKLDPNATYAKAEFSIEGMTCAIGCAKTIEKKIAKMEGVKSAKVDFDKRLAMVEYDDAKVTPTSLEAIVKKAGESYSVTDMKTVDAFSAKTACGSDCKKACCANKTTKSCSGDKACKTKCSADCTDKDCTKCATLKAECKKVCDAKKAACTAASKCSPNCTEKDCAKCAAKKAECKKKCDTKKADTSGDKKTACAADCKKACCAEKKA